MPTHAVSIIIPSRDDGEAVARTLDHLTGVEGRSGVEVIVAASGGRQRAENAVAGRARLLWPPGSTRAALMNAGAAQARGDILWLLFRFSLGLDTERYAERWRGPAGLPPGSPWPRRSRGG